MFHIKEMTETPEFTVPETTAPVEFTSHSSFTEILTCMAFGI